MVIEYVCDSLSAYLSTYPYNVALFKLNQGIYIPSLNISISLINEGNFEYLHIPCLNEELKNNIKEFFSVPTSYKVNKKNCLNSKTEINYDNIPFNSYVDKINNVFVDENIFQYGILINGDKYSGKTTTINSLLNGLNYPYCKVNLEKTLANYTQIDFEKMKENIENLIVKNLSSKIFILVLEDVSILLNNSNEQNKGALDIVTGYFFK